MISKVVSLLYFSLCSEKWKKKILKKVTWSKMKITVLSKLDGDTFTKLFVAPLDEVAPPEDPQSCENPPEMSLHGNCYNIAT